MYPEALKERYLVRKEAYFIHEEAVLSHQTYQGRKCFSEMHNDPVSRSSHPFLFKMVLYTIIIG